MKKIIILTTNLIMLSIASLKAMETRPPKTQNIYNQMFGTTKQKMGSLGRTFYDLYKKDFFNREISKKSKDARLRNVKAYLNYIIMILDLPGNKGATIADLPTTPTGENLAEQTKEVLDGWGLQLVNKAAPGKDANWVLLPAGDIGGPALPGEVATLRTEVTDLKAQLATAKAAAGAPAPATLKEAIDQAASAADAVKTAADAYTGDKAKETRDDIRARVAGPLSTIKTT